MKRDKSAITLSDKSREQAIASLRRYVEENLDEKIGDLKAALLLDYILEATRTRDLQPGYRRRAAIF